MEPEELADSLKRLVARAEQHAPKPEPAVRRRLPEHLGGDPAEFGAVDQGADRSEALPVGSTAVRPGICAATRSCSSCSTALQPAMVV